MSFHGLSPPPPLAGRTGGMLVRRCARLCLVRKGDRGARGAMARSRATRYAQQQRARDRLQRQARAEAERVARAQAAEVRAAERKARGAHLAEQDRRAANATTEIDRRVAELGSILTDGLHRSARIDLATTRHQAHAPSVDLGTLGKPETAPRWEDFLPPSPGWLSRAFGGEGRYAARRAASYDALA